MGNVLVKDLPVWLQEIIRKKLGNRMARESVDQMMDGTLDDVTDVMDTNLKGKE